MTEVMEESSPHRRTPVAGNGAGDGDGAWPGQEELPEDLTGLLNAWTTGDEDAGREVVEGIYGNLHRMAARQLANERGDVTLQATALVNEVYLRLASLRALRWQGRVHFFGSVSQIIRRVLVDHARKFRAAKRGSGVRAEPMEEGLLVWTEQPEDFLALHDALDQLEIEDPELAAIVLHRYFGGFSNDEIGDLLGKSPATIKRRFRVARAWLYRELSGST